MKATRQATWKPISTAPKDGTNFLAWMNGSWIEMMQYIDGSLVYSSDGDTPPYGRCEPKFWMELPPPPVSESY